MPDLLQLALSHIAAAVNSLSGSPPGLNTIWSPQIVGTIVGALIAGTIALVLAWINNRSNNARQARLLEHNAGRERGRVRQERLEELYVLSSQWSSSLNSLTVAALDLARGTKSAEVFALEYTATMTSIQNDSRRKMLLDVFGTADIREAQKNMDQARVSCLNYIHMVQMSADLRHLGDPVDKSAVSRLSSLAAGMTDAGRTLLATIAEEAAG